MVEVLKIFADQYSHPGTDNQHNNLVYWHEYTVSFVSAYGGSYPSGLIGKTTWRVCLGSENFSTAQGIDTREQFAMVTHHQSKYSTPSFLSGACR